MPEAYYIIPMVSGPYSRENPQRPEYVDTIKCNWTGHNVDLFGVYICLVNTTEAKHTLLASSQGVWAFPADVTWDTQIADMQAAIRSFINTTICPALNIPYDETETMGEFIQRVLSSGLFELLENTPLDTLYSELPVLQQNKIDLLFRKLGIDYAATDTVQELSQKFGPRAWPGNDRSKVSVVEY